MGQFTADFREHVHTSQILVCVPEMLEILLLNTNLVFRKRLKRVIFDEVHCIGSNEGEVWERLLLLVDVPFLALSATLGNSDHLYTWLGAVERGRGRELFFVEHKERFNDLSTLVYAAPESAGAAAQLVPVHPAWAMDVADKGFPLDLKLLPEHCVSLYDALACHLGSESPSIQASVADLAPEKYFEHVPNVSWDLGMRDVQRWADSLKSALLSLSPDGRNAVLKECSDQTSIVFDRADQGMGETRNRKELETNVLPLLLALKSEQALPCLVFHLARRGCERLAIRASDELAKMEYQARQSEGTFLKIAKLQKELDENGELLKRTGWDPEQNQGSKKDQEATEYQQQHLEQRQKLSRDLKVLVSVDARFALLAAGQPVLQEDEILEVPHPVKR